jgi:hypothetical protein
MIIFLPVAGNRLPVAGVINPSLQSYDYFYSHANIF